MSFDASGTFTRTNGIGSTGSKVWQDDASAGIEILDTRHDTHDQDLANGLSQCLLRNGAGVPTAHTPWGGFKITNLGNPTNQQDVATKYYVDHPDAAITARDINGADLNGRLNFTALSGVNGITWTYADLSWVARGAKAGEALNRLVLNNSATPPTNSTSGDVFVLDDAGFMNFGGHLMNNGAYDGTWRTVTPGFITMLRLTGGNFSFFANDTATITNPYAPAAIREYFTIGNNAGTVSINTYMSKSGDTAGWLSSGSGGGRWLLRLGNGVAESGVATGSDFDISAFSNTGAYIGMAMGIERANLNVTFGGKLVSVDDHISNTGYFISAGTVAILAATGAGNVYLRPNGRDNGAGQTTINSAGAMAVGGAITAASTITAAGEVISNNGYFQSTAGQAVLGCGSGNVCIRPNGIGSATGQAYVTTAGDLNVSNNVIVAGGAVQGGNGITLNAAGYGDFARSGTATGMGFARFLNASGIIGSITSESATGVAYNKTSDERLKDVRGLYDPAEAIAIIRADPVRTFTWKSSGEDAIGWLAQRSYAVDKNLASPPEMTADGQQVDPNDRWGIDYGNRAPYLWAALSAALDQIDALTARIGALEAA